MMGRLVRLVVCLVSLGVFSCVDWCTKQAVPTFVAYGDVCVFSNDKVLYATPNYASVYDPALDTWTIVNPSPSARETVVLEPVAADRAVLVGAPYNSATPSNEEFNLSTGQWVTRASLPAARRHIGGANDGAGLVWSLGAEAPEKNVWAYNAAQDEWATKTPMPSSMVSPQCAKIEGNIHCVKTTQEVYAISTDTWTTSVSAPAGVSFPMVDSFGGIIYCLAPSKTLLEYTVATTTWTSRSEVLPVAIANSGAVMLSTGMFLVVHSTTHGIQLHSTPASLQGDPLLSSFAGHVYKSILHPGVFNLFTSPHTIVNVLVDELPTLPPDDRTVVIAVQVLGHAPCGFFLGQVDSRGSVSVGSDGHCHYQAYKSAEGIRFSLLDYDVEVVLHEVNVIESGALWPTSAYLDVAVHPSGPLTRSSGLLGDLDFLADDVIQRRFSEGYYTVENGCLAAFAPCTLDHASPTAKALC